MADSSPKQADLSDVKRKLLERRLRRRKSLKNGAAKPTDPPTIPKLDRGASVPLSFGQERLWFLSQLQQASTAYNMHCAVKIEGQLDYRALGKAWQTVVQRHDALRTIFMWRDGALVQEKTNTVPAIKIERCETEKAATALATGFVQRAFDLEKGEVFRVAIIKIANNSHILVLTLHHIVCDEWSLDVIWQEWGAAYSAEIKNKPILLKQVQRQFGDYAAWRRGQSYEKAQAYWKTQLGGELPTLELPFDRPRPATQSFRGDIVKRELSAELSHKISAMSKDNRATPFMTLLAAFNVLLYRYTGQPDFTVGIPITNRDLAEIQQTVGFFVNTAIIRAPVKPEDGFLAYLATVRQIALDAYAHQELPFEQLVATLQPERALSHNPLFQVMTVMLTQPQWGDWANLTLTGLELPFGVSKFDLSFMIEQVADRYVLRFEYSSDLFDDATMTRWLSHLERLLISITEAPTDAIQTLEILPKPEKMLVVETWNKTDFPVADGLLHELIERHAVEKPENRALIFAEQSLTYAQLDEWANQIAHVLVGDGIRPNQTVGIFVERSLEMIVGILAVLKSGAAYVPLDPTYPAQRLAFMQSDAELSAILTTPNVRDRLPESNITTVDLSSREHGQARGKPEIATVSADLAYIIYTSGSTGKPKGVRVSHANLLNFVAAHDRCYHEPFASFLLLSSFSFDSSKVGIMWTLTAGATLILPEVGQEKAPRELAKLIHQHTITHTLCLPSLYDLLLDLSQKGQLTSLKHVCVAGEVCAPALVGKHYARLPDCNLHNGYGPTETTVWSSTHTTTNRGYDNVPIGPPIANTQTYVLDKNLLPQPIGVAGELVVGGLSVAQGYHNRPKLTASRFIDRPKWLPAGSRLFRTGDRVRWLPSGEIEFLGRLDNQVKIRGHRIELGAVENALLSQPAIQHAVAVAWDGATLAAYVELAPDTHTTPAQIKQTLAPLLPGYMIPSSIGVLAQLPRMPNGKVDRRALPHPQEARALVSGQKETETERSLGVLWREVLGVETVGAHDNFFELGGHSLLAVRLFAAIEDRFGRKLPVELLFQAPTVAELAPFVQDEEPDEWSLVVKLRDGSAEPFFLIHGFGGGLLLYQDLVQSLAENHSVFGVRAIGLLGEDTPQNQIEAMAATYVEAIRKVQPEGPYRLGGYCHGGIVAFEMARQLRQDGAEVGLVAIVEGYAPLVERDSIWSRPKNFLALIRNLPYWVRDYRNLGNDELLLRAKRRLRLANNKLKGKQQHNDVEDVLAKTDHLREAHRHIMMAHLRAMQNYRPKTKLDAPLTLFRSRAGGSLLRSHDTTMGWDALVTQPISVEIVAGSHYNILEDPQVASLGVRLSAELSQDGTS